MYTSHYWPEPGVRLAVSQSDSQYHSQMIFTQPASESFDLPLMTMDLPPAWSQTCVCGCAFSLPQAYTFYQRSCQRTKKQLLGALEKAKDILQARKHHKVVAAVCSQLKIYQLKQDPLANWWNSHIQMIYPFL